jgi:signal transduction histidine kinase
MAVQQSVRVLIAEDDFLVGELIRSQIEQMGYEVVETAATGEEAVAMTMRHHPDVVLMDLAMPGIDGIEATRRIGDCCPTPVVAVSAHGSPERVQRASAAGIGAYVAKPPTARDMDRAITIARARFADMMRAKELTASLQAQIAESGRLTAERRSIEDQMVLSQRSDIVGNIVGGIAHNFNNLFTAVLCNIELASDQLVPTSDTARILEDAIDSVAQATNLTRQMMAYCGQSLTRKVRLRLNDEVDAARPLLDATAGGRCRVRFDIGDVTGEVSADQAQVRQLVSNLFINAVEAASRRPDGEVRVSVGSGTARFGDYSAIAGLRPDSPAVWIGVWDNGEGIPASLQEKIFEPFFTTKFFGRGLGLAAVQGIVTGHGGIVEVTSAPETGTTFRVAFPVAT